LTTDRLNDLSPISANIQPTCAVVPIANVSSSSQVENIQCSIQSNSSVDLNVNSDCFSSSNSTTCPECSEEDSSSVCSSQCSCCSCSTHSTSSNVDTTLFTLTTAPSPIVSRCPGIPHVRQERDPALPHDIYNEGLIQEFRHAMSVPTHNCPGTCEKNYACHPSDSARNDTSASNSINNSMKSLPIKKCSKGTIYEIPMQLINLPKYDALQEFQRNNCPSAPLTHKSYSAENVHVPPRIDLLHGSHPNLRSRFSRISSMKRAYEILPNQRVIARIKQGKIIWKPPVDAQRRRLSITKRKPLTIIKPSEMKPELQIAQVTASSASSANRPGATNESPQINVKPPISTEVLNIPIHANPFECLKDERNSCNDNDEENSVPIIAQGAPMTSSPVPMARKSVNAIQLTKNVQVQCPSAMILHHNNESISNQSISENLLSTIDLEESIPRLSLSSTHSSVQESPCSTNMLVDAESVNENVNVTNVEEKMKETLCSSNGMPTCSENDYMHYISTLPTYKQCPAAHATRQSQSVVVGHLGDESDICSEGRSCKDNAQETPHVNPTKVSGDNCGPHVNLTMAIPNVSCDQSSDFTSVCDSPPQSRSIVQHISISPWLVDTDDESLLAEEAHSVNMISLRKNPIHSSKFTQFGNLNQSNANQISNSISISNATHNHQTHSTNHSRVVSQAPTLILNHWLPKFIFHTSEGNIRFLVDSGAVQSFVTKNFRASPNFKSRILPDTYTVANGVALIIYGSIELKIEIASKIYRHVFLVANVKVNLLGVEFQRDYRLSLLWDPPRLAEAFPDAPTANPYNYWNSRREVCNILKHYDENVKTTSYFGDSTYDETANGNAFHSEPDKCNCPGTSSHSGSPAASHCCTRVRPAAVVSIKTTPGSSKVHAINAVDNDDIELQIAENSERDTAALRAKYAFVFGDTDKLDKPPRDSGVRMHIGLNGQYSRTKFYNVARNLEEKIRPTLDEWEERGIMRRCLKGAYCAPMLAVPKKNGKYRPVIDYRDLNLVSEPYYHRLPRIDSIKQDMNGRIFSAMDLTDAFFQVAVEPDDIPKTAVQTPKGLYEFVKMPFGMKNAPSYFQAHIEIVLDNMRKFTIAYIDDILVFSRSYEEHLEHLTCVFDRLQEYGMIINVDKSKFFQTKIQFLGLEFTQFGYRPPLDYMPKIENFARPATKKGVQSFLGLVNYYRSHIPKIADIEEPLRRISGPKCVFAWGDDQEAAFLKLKEEFKKRLALCPIDYDIPFELYCDSSRIALGACLTQGPQRIVDFFSRKLTPVEQRYPIHTLEAFAIVEAILHFRRVLIGKHFIVYTDHSALERWFLNDPINEKHAQLITKLQDFQFTIKFIKGTDNVMADFASRPHNNGISSFDELRKQLDKNAAVNAVVRIDLKSLIRHHADKHFVDKDKRIRPKRVITKDGVFYYSPKTKDTPVILIPPGLRKKVISDAHDLGHSGIKRCCRVLRQNVFWPGMYQDIEEYINSCHKCLQHKRRPPANYPSFHIRCTERFKVLHMDIVGPFQQSANKNEYILTMIDRFTRWVCLVPMSTITSFDVAQALFNKWICQMGLPEIIITDQGSQFDSEVFANVCCFFGIEKRRTTAWNPKCNGLVERMHSTMKEIIATKTNDYDDWEAALPIAQYVLNSAINKHGVSPSMCLYGEQIPMPSVLFDRPPVDLKYRDPLCTSFVQAIAHNLRNMRKYLLKCDAVVNPQCDSVPKLKKEFKMVFVKIMPKVKALQPKYAGPALVIDVKGKVLTIKWIHNGKIERVSADRVKPVHKVREEFANIDKPINDPMTWLVKEENNEIVCSKLGLDLLSHSSHEDKYPGLSLTNEIAQGSVKKSHATPDSRLSNLSTCPGATSSTANAQGTNCCRSTHDELAKLVMSKESLKSMKKQRKKVKIDFHKSESSIPSELTPEEQTQCPARNTRIQTQRRIDKKHRCDKHKRKTNMYGEVRKCNDQVLHQNAQKFSSSKSTANSKYPGAPSLTTCARGLEELSSLSSEPVSNRSKSMSIFNTIESSSKKIEESAQVFANQTQHDVAQVSDNKVHQETAQVLYEEVKPASLHASAHGADATLGVTENSPSVDEKLVSTVAQDLVASTSAPSTAFQVRKFLVSASRQNATPEETATKSTAVVSFEDTVQYDTKEVSMPHHSDAKPLETVVSMPEEAKATCSGALSETYPGKVTAQSKRPYWFALPCIYRYQRYDWRKVK